MHVLITGASGYLGGVVAAHLAAQGHAVTALARTPQAEAAVAARGAAPLRGALADADVLRAAARAADAVVHAAVDYADPDFGAHDARALDALLDAAPARLVYLSTTLVYGDTGLAPADEDRPCAPLVQAFKVEGERRVLGAGGETRGTVVRPGLVHGSGESAFFAGLRAGAAEHGAVTYVGDGASRWSLVHAGDVAALVARVLERGVGGEVFNAASAEAPALRAVSEHVAASLGVPAVSVPVEEARAAMGDVADQLTRDLVVDASRARRALGWAPEGPTLLG